MSFTKLMTWFVSVYKDKVTPFSRQLFAVLEVVFYTTLPTIILVLFSIIDKELLFKETLGSCYIHGEFLLYSIALLSSAYTTMKVYKSQNTSFVIILIIVVSILYAITIRTTNNNLDVSSLLWISIIASVFSFCFTWRAMSLKETRQKSFQERDKKDSDEIQDNLKYE